MNRQGWIWVFLKAFGIWLFVTNFRNLGFWMQMLGVPPPGRGGMHEFSTNAYLATVLVVYAASLVLILRTGWVMKLLGIKPAEPESAESPAGREGLLWVILKGIGAYFFVIAAAGIPDILEYPLREGNLPTVLYFAAGLFLMLHTGFAIRLLGAKTKGEDEAPGEGWSSPEGRRSTLWVFFKGIGAYFVLLAILKVPFATYDLLQGPGAGDVPYTGPDGGTWVTMSRWRFIDVGDEYLRLAIGICLIVFTGFFVRLVMRFGRLHRPEVAPEPAGE